MSVWDHFVCKCSGILPCRGDLSSSGRGVDVGAGVHAVIRPNQHRADSLLTASCSAVSKSVSRPRFYPAQGVLSRWLTLEDGDETEILV